MVSPDINQPFTFTSREYDSESGLYFYRARYYDPRAGRFITKDPIGFLGGDVNMYRYVFNNPVNLRDPLGLYDENEVHLVVTYQRALKAGIDANTAWKIAWESRSVDVNILTSPDFPISWLTGSLYFYHFHLANDNLNKNLRKSCEMKDPKSFGRNIHRLEDTFPHMLFNSMLFAPVSPIAHLLNMQTDVYDEYSQRDQRMLKQVDYWMGEFAKHYNGNLVWRSR